MRIFKNEFGRSMVEMLGVLAVIGVLSVGGIIGYKFAIDKYQANQTINDINLRALDILIQQSENKPILLDEWENTASIFPIELVFDGETTEERALIQVSNVPQNVCKILVNDMKSRSEVSINGYITEDGSNIDCTATNTLAFYFGNNEPCGSTIVHRKPRIVIKKRKRVNRVLWSDNVQMKSRYVVIFNVRLVRVENPITMLQQTVVENVLQMLIVPVKMRFVSIWLVKDILMMLF